MNVSAQVISRCVCNIQTLWLKHIHGNIPFMLDNWADPDANLLLKSFVVEQLLLTTAEHGSNPVVDSKQKRDRKWPFKN